MNLSYIRNYSNPFWEPIFPEISPFLANLYQKSNSGFVKYILASIIFHKLSIIEDISFRKESYHGN